MIRDIENQVTISFVWNNFSNFLFATFLGMELSLKDLRRQLKEKNRTKIK